MRWNVAACLTLLLGCAGLAKSEPVIYEVNMRAFSAKGDFKGVTARLDDIKRLGVDVVWLMPVHPVGQVKSAGGLGSPYAVQNYLKVNPEFGTPTDLTDLINGAHERGMKVIIDWVADHTAWDNPWLADKSMYKQDAKGNVIIPPGTNWQDVAALDFSSPKTRQKMVSAMQFWVDQYKIDGFRCDYAEGVPTSFWASAIAQLRGKRPVLMLAEGAKSDLRDAGFDLTYDWEIYGASQDLYSGKSAPAQFMARALQDKGVMRFTSNHDEAAWSDSAVHRYGGVDAALGAFLVTTFSAGSPLVYGGQEIGWRDNIPFFTRSTIDWSNGAKIRAIYERCLSVGKLAKGKGLDFSTPQAVIFSRPENGHRLWVVVNPTQSAVSTKLPYNLGRVHDLVSDKLVTLSDQVELAPFQSMVFESKATD